MFWFAFSLVQAFVAITFGGEAFADLIALAQQEGQPDPARVFELYRQLAPFIAVMIPVYLLFYGVMFAAAYRAVLEPSGGLGLRFGAQEVRQAMLLVVICAVMFVVYAGVLLVGGVIAALALAVNQALGALVVALVLFAVIAAMVYVAIRLSLSGAHSFDTRHVRPFGSWAISKGRFWPMAGAYFLALVFSIIVGVLGMLILFGLFALTGGEFGAALARPAGTSLADVFSPSQLVYLVGSAVLSALTWAILVSPAAVIYRQIREPSQAF